MTNPIKSSMRQYDGFGRREGHPHFIAREICRLYERYEEYESNRMTSAFNHMVRYLPDLYFAPNEKIGGSGLMSKKADKTGKLIYLGHTEEKRSVSLENESLMK